MFFRNRVVSLFQKLYGKTEEKSGSTNNSWKKSARITPKRIIDAVASFYGLSTRELKRRTRRKESAFARQVAMYLLREYSDRSYPSIGRDFGLDHTTAIHSHKKILASFGRSPDLWKQIEEIVNSFGGSYRPPHVIESSLQGISNTDAFSSDIQNGKIEAGPTASDEDVMKIKIYDLKLSARTMNALREAGIKTIGGLTRRREKTLQEIRGLGEKGIKEIEEALNNKGNIRIKSALYSRDKERVPKTISLESLEREKAILTEYRDGKTLEVIGRKFGVTRERIRQIVLRGIFREIEERESEGFEIDTKEFLLQEKLRHDQKQAQKNLTAPEVSQPKKERWSRYYPRCRGCETTIIPHLRKGYCERCAGGFRAERRDRIIADRGNKCENCGMHLADARKKFGRDFYIMRRDDALAVLCRECFLDETGRRMGHRPRRKGT